MTHRRTYPAKSPALTGGEDRPRPACEGQPDAFDVLIDSQSGAEFRAALGAARSLCEECPIRVACHAANRDEPWVKALNERPRRRHKRQPAKCGTHAGWYAHKRRDEAICDPCRLARNAYVRNRRGSTMTKAEALEVGRIANQAKVREAAVARIEDLRRLVDSGAGIEEACQQLSVRRTALQTWCRRNGVSELYRALCAPTTKRPNQYTKGAA